MRCFQICFSHNFIYFCGCMSYNICAFTDSTEVISIIQYSQMYIVTEVYNLLFFLIVMKFPCIFDFYEIFTIVLYVDHQGNRISIIHMLILFSSFEYLQHIFLAVHLNMRTHQTTIFFLCYKNVVHLHCKGKLQEGNFQCPIQTLFKLVHSKSGQK